MPELPDITVYVEALERSLAGRRLERARLGSPFLLRTVDPPLAEAEGKRVAGARRIGKRIALVLEGELFLVLHLMIAGRLRWRPAGARLPGRLGLAAFDFAHGTLLLTEAGSRRRASLHVLRGETALRTCDPGGLELLEGTFADFLDVMRRENRTLKRALTDPRIVSGVGNAYSDEILHRARLSPARRTRQAEEAELRRLWEAARGTLLEWTERLRREAGGGFPEEVTAFREGMAVHGRFRQACPDCGAPVQRIVYADRESNYCPGCQTGGKLLADRALSRLLKGDWPRTLEELDP